MAKTNPPEDTIEVARLTGSRSKVKTGKPRKIVTGSMRAKTATGGLVGGGSMYGSGGNFYSPELSTDFLELPQSVDEQRNYYRFFYQTDPYVGQAIDLHTELPLSKIRLQMPKAKSRELAQKALSFCEDWSRKVGLLHRLIEIVHDYYLVGEVFIFVEDTSPDMPDDVKYETKRVLTEDGDAIEEVITREDFNQRMVDWTKDNYKGWSAIRVLPPEQIHMDSFPFTDEKLIELVPDSKTKDLISQADMGDIRAQKIVDSMPQDVVNAIRLGENITLNTDLEAGSFVYYLARKKSQYEPRGHSILERCVRTLVYRDKLRQAQTSIASRHMTPVRVVYAEDMDAADTEELRDQIDMALMDPDYSVVANFQINWEELGSNNRLLQLDTEYDLTNRQLYAGLGVTEALLSGEASYGGDRINLEVINTRYMLLREILQDFIEEHIFRPMCARMGFLEVDEELGTTKVIYPGLSFTRLGLRDNSDTFADLFNLYQKGSVDIDVILDLLNIDPTTTSEKLKKHLFTIKDPTFNEMMRTIYTDIGSKLSENTDLVQRIASDLGLDYKEPEEEDPGRF